MKLIMLIFLGDESPTLRNLHGCQNVFKNIFVYWKSKKLEEDLVLVVEWNVSFSKDVGLQGRTLLNITLFCGCFLRFIIRLMVVNRETHQIQQIFV